MSIDEKCVNTIRVLAADTVCKANSGHPGAPIGLAPAAHMLWAHHLDFEPGWINRDRFVLGAGHASALIYSMLHLHSDVLSMDDLKQFRQYQSKTPGHPERHTTSALECTTGCLGAGLSNAVGMAIASKHMAARFNKPDMPLFTNKVFCFSSDGDMEEGIGSEVSSHAGNLKLNNLVVFWDNNSISISGKTDITFSDDVPARYRSYGWRVIEVDNANTDLAAINAAIEAALQESERPVLVALRTIIGFGSDVENTSTVHGSPLKPDQLKNLKTHYGFNPEEFFAVAPEVYDFYKGVRARIHGKVEQWNEMYKAYEQKYPAEFADLQCFLTDKFDAQKVLAALPRDNTKAIASRSSSGVVLNALASALPNIVGGSADLTPSTSTALKSTTVFSPEHPEGRYFEFGVREHGMAGICNGMQYYLPGFVPFCATFYIFLQYALPAVRLAALESLRVLYVFTHDSIGLGEDGPTHQNVENFAVARSLPNSVLLRPADSLEVSACYAIALTGPSKPYIFALSRQNLPPVPGSSFEGAMKGAYIVKAAEKPKLVIIATGSEVELAVKAADLLDYPVQVVSMPSTQIFDEQEDSYKRTVLPDGVPVLSVEAGISFGWDKYSHLHHGVETFGLSAPAPKVYEHFHMTPDGIVAKAQRLVKFYENKPVPSKVDLP